MIKEKNILYLLAFFEGGALISLEIICGKLLAPYFGTSIYVWSGIIGITLGGLILGYLLGGFLSKKNRLFKIITVLYLGLSIVIIIIPFLSQWILESLKQLEIRVGIILSLISFMLVPIIIMATMGPLIIQILTNIIRNPGKSAGLIYAISTIGGVVFVFLFGFWIIPTVGLKLSAIGLGSTLAIIIFISRVILGNRLNELPVNR